MVINRKAPVVDAWDAFFDDPGIDLPPREQPELPLRVDLRNESSGGANHQTAAEEGHN